MPTENYIPYIVYDYVIYNNMLYQNLYKNIVLYVARNSGAITTSFAAFCFARFLSLVQFHVQIRHDNKLCDSVVTLYFENLQNPESDSVPPPPRLCC